MSLTRQQKKIAELHQEYESRVKLFKFAVKNAETKEDKEKFGFQLKISESMSIVLELLCKFLEGG